MNLAITGHRPQKLAGPEVELQVRAMLRWLFGSVKPTWVISGMALGVDQWAAEEAMLLRIPVLAAIPCWEQEHFWSDSAKRKYHELLSRVQHREQVTDTVYAPGVMQRRNEWMIDRANAVGAVFDGTDGGTCNAVKYAIGARKPIFRYDPRTLKSEWIGVPQ